MWSRNEADYCSTASDASPFGAAEKEQLVLDDSATNRISELIACEYSLVNPVGVVVEIVLSQRRDTIELVERAME